MSAAHRQAGRPWAAWASLALLLACVPGLVRILAIVPMCAVTDYNEGWNAMHADALLRGEPLYRPIGDPYHNNYPPLAFHPVAWLTRWLDDAIIAGRVMALAAFGLCALLCALLARAWGASRSLAWLCAVFVLALFLSHSHYVGINDPQMMGHALALGGLLLVGRPARSTRAVVAGAVLLAGSGFVKHNLIVLPVALLLWLWMVDRPRVLAYVAAGLVAAALMWATSGALHGWDFMRHLVAPREYVNADALRGSAVWLAKGAPLLAPLAWALWRWPRQHSLLLAGLWAGICVLSGAWFIGGRGVDQNVFFDAYFAGAFGLALVVMQLGAPGERGEGDSHASPASMPRPTPPLAWAAVAACALLPLLVSTALRVQPAWAGTAYWLQPLRAESRATVELSRVYVQRRQIGDCGRPVQCYQSRVLRDVGHLACRG